MRLENAWKLFFFCVQHWKKELRNNFFSMALPAHSVLGALIQFRNYFSQTLNDQPVARHRATQAENKRIHQLSMP
jgi:hypothetical protein